MMPFHPLSHPTTRRIALISLSLPVIYAARTMSITTRPSTTTTKPTFPTRAYNPRHNTFPYTAQDFRRQDESSDTDFYAQPRFVTHIDDHAIGLLQEYYKGVLPRRGRVLDLCSSWISHFPRELEEGAVRVKEGGGMQGEGLEVIGLGMNAAELRANPILNEVILRDLNVDPYIPKQVAPLDATVCVVSIDYLTKPLEVLSSLRDVTKEGGRVHLIVSNRCFPTKAVGRWLRVGETERLEMVGDYLHHSGWRDVEIVEVCDGKGDGEGWMGLLRGGVDPLWVVRGVKGNGGGGKGVGRSEL